MLLGIDVSKWQLIMDWHKARSGGARFAFIRAGSIDSVSGTCYTDYQFDRNSEIAPDYFPVGFYWYFRPNFDPIKQANYFCNLIRKKRYLLPPVIDLETDGEMSAIKVTEAATIFVIEVFKQLNVWCLLYSRALWLNGHTIKAEIWSRLELWIARYINLSGPWADGKCIPRDFKDWRFWQKSADGNGRGKEFGAKSRSIDITYFNGDQAGLNTYIGEAGHLLVRVISSLAASLRSGPEGSAIGATWRGAMWPVIEKVGDYYRIEGWIKADKVEEI